jgi:beta-fructofuranosidase
VTLRLADRWVWDFWVAREGVDYHVFYLQAPREFVKQELRHWNASVGHAVSRDLRNWRVLPDALHPGPEGVWDDGAIWTGSVVERDGTWYMLYTGINTRERQEEAIVQRIGLATSTDLIRWEKHPQNPLVEADPRYYGQRALSPLGPERMWRDPWVFRHPRTGEYHAFITAQTIEGPPDGRGVIGHARSSDLVSWETLPPLTEPGHFYALEVPQLVELGGRYYLLFSTWAEAHSAARREETRLEPVGGTHYLVADDPLGPFRFSTHDFLIGDAVGSLYSGKLVEGPDGRPYFLAWRNFTPDGAFVGELADPSQVAVDSEGNLSVWRP